MSPGKSGRSLTESMFCFQINGLHYFSPLGFGLPPPSKRCSETQLPSPTVPMQERYRQGEAMRHTLPGQGARCPVREATDFPPGVASLPPTGRHGFGMAEGRKPLATPPPPPPRGRRCRSSSRRRPSDGCSGATRSSASGCWPGGGGTARWSISAACPLPGLVWASLSVVACVASTNPE